MELTWNARVRLVRRFLLLTALLMSAPTVWAHSLLQDSKPARDAVVNEPRQIQLQFNEPVRMLRLEITGPAGAVDIGFRPAAQASVDVTRDLPDLVPGEYRVEWTLIGGDGHTVSEDLRFTVQSAGS